VVARGNEWRLANRSWRQAASDGRLTPLYSGSLACGPRLAHRREPPTLSLGENLLRCNFTAAAAPFYLVAVFSKTGPATSMPPPDVTAVSATKKTCRVLASLTDRRVHRLTDIAQSAALDISTARRILKDLEAEGFVERDPVSKHYMLGPQVYAMHHAMVDGLDVRALARPALIRLARRLGDTVILSLPMGWESVCLDLCFGDYPIRANYLEVGSRRPLGVGAGSLALLSTLDESESRAVLPMVRQRLAIKYPRYPERDLDLATQRARALGHAMLLDVVVEKMGGLGVAVRGPSGRAIAALSVAALNERIESREQELAQALSHEAREIERAWLPHA